MKRSAHIDYRPRMPCSRRSIFCVFRFRSWRAFITDSVSVRMKHRVQSNRRDGNKRLAQFSNIQLNSNSYDHTIHHRSSSRVILEPDDVDPCSGTSRASNEEGRDEKGRTSEE